MRINVDRLANEHWDYVSKVMQTSGCSLDDLELAEFHYKTAFIHGYKHAFEATACDGCDDKIVFMPWTNEDD